jgi:hypothetical protein
MPICFLNCLPSNKMATAKAKAKAKARTAQSRTARMATVICRMPISNLQGTVTGPWTPTQAKVSSLVISGRCSTSPTRMVARPQPGSKQSSRLTLDVAVRQAANIAQKHGSLPAEIAEKVRAAGDSKTTWYEHLQNLVIQMSDNDYTWKMPSEDYVQQDLYMPSIEGEGLPPIVIMVDVSSSMTQQQLIQIAREVVQIVDEFNVDVHIIYVNTKVVGHETVHASELNPEDFTLHFQGRGGTDFRPGFKWLETEFDDDEVYAVLYFTDLECNRFPEEEPPYPVIWCEFNDLGYSSSYVRTPPWGHHIKIDLHD